MGNHPKLGHAARLALLGSVLVLGRPALADEARPGELLIYYAYPSMINGAATIDDAAAEFGLYDVAVIGDGLQDGPGDPNPHPDHANTVAIIAHAANRQHHVLWLHRLGSDHQQPHPDRDRTAR